MSKENIFFRMTENTIQLLMTILVIVFPEQVETIRRMQSMDPSIAKLIIDFYTENEKNRNSNAMKYIMQSQRATSVIDNYLGDITILLDELKKASELQPSSNWYQRIKMYLIKHNIFLTCLSFMIIILINMIVVVMNIPTLVLAARLSNMIPESV